MTDREKAAQNYSASRVNDPKDPREIEHFKAGWDAHAKKAEALVEAIIKKLEAHGCFCEHPNDDFEEPPTYRCLGHDIGDIIQAYKGGES